MTRARARRERGAAFVTSFVLLVLLGIAGASYLDRSTQAMRLTRRQQHEIQTSHLCEAGIQSELRALWRPFKVKQRFTDMDSQLTGASENSPKASVTGTIPGVGAFSVGVVGYTKPADDTYTRLVLIRAVGWVDFDKDGKLDAGEPRRTVDAQSAYQLVRSQVFDYMQFVNNYGFAKNFTPTTLVVNGDVRSNGDYEIIGSSVPTINGSVTATNNEKLSPAATGTITGTPAKWSNSDYTAFQNATGGAANDQTEDENRWRQAYDPAKHGAKGSAEYEKWRDLIFDTEGGLLDERLFGSTLNDNRGRRSWNRSGTGNSTYSLLDKSTPKEIIMPDLSDLSYYLDLADDYRNPKQKYGDGTQNPNYNRQAYIEVYDTASKKYKEITDDGVVTGSALIVGTDANPIRIHGPVVVTQDVLIKGRVTGQGTIYAGRNIHIVGSIRYLKKPNFRGASPQAIDNANEKMDMLGLAARGSVLVGNTLEYDDSENNVLPYMRPPFTKGRYDDAGKWVPAFDAMQRDSTGKMLYQTVMGDSLMQSVAEGVSQLDALVYTNNMMGGLWGTAGTGVTWNGAQVSKSSANMMMSTPTRLNYDGRVQERVLTEDPLIDLQLPRSPTLLRSSWQARSFSYGN